VGDHVDAVNRLIQRSQLVALHATLQAQHTRQRVERTYQRALHTAEATRAVFQAAAAIADRFFEVKQRELATHLAAMRLHEQAAELQERWGWPARAAEARAHAGHARELYELAGQELATYLVQVQAARHETDRPPEQPA
jgi:hypothetical protein